MNHRKVARVAALDQLVSDGFFTSERAEKCGKSLATLAKALGLRYPDGTYPKGIREREHAILQWSRTRNRIVTARYEDSPRKEKISHKQGSSAKLSKRMKGLRRQFMSVRDGSAINTLAEELGVQRPKTFALFKIQIAKAYAEKQGVPFMEAHHEKLLQHALGKTEDAFRKLVDAGTVISSGMQRHLPNKKTNEDFYNSKAWRSIRYMAFKQYGKHCMCCGATAQSGVVMHVDHIKPRSKFPELALTLSNLQILCEDCNIGKGAWDSTDWRAPR